MIQVKISLIVPPNILATILELKYAHTLHGSQEISEASGLVTVRHPMSAIRHRIQQTAAQTNFKFIYFSFGNANMS